MMKIKNNIFCQTTVEIETHPTLLFIYYSHVKNYIFIGNPVKCFKESEINRTLKSVIIESNNNLTSS